MRIPENMTTTIVLDKDVAADSQTATYTRIVSVEAAEADDVTIVAQSRDQYVDLFKQGVQKTARATLDMCRVAYEASRMLNEADFDAFAKAIGYRDNSSTIRKFIAIGKLQPRLAKYADQLPHSWTSIYALTQIPAAEFEYMLENGKSLASLRGAALTDLVKSTQDLTKIEGHLPRDKETKHIVFGALHFTKKPDDTDWRAMRKALAELEARLPIRFVVNAQAQYVWEQRKNQRYELTKKVYEGTELKPELWDLGREANAVQAEITAIEQEAQAKIKAVKALVRAEIANAAEQEIDLAKAEAQAAEADADASKPFFNSAIWDAEANEQEQAA